MTRSACRRRSESGVPCDSCGRDGEGKPRTPPFVSEVARYGALLVGQFVDDESQHVEHTANHLNLVDVLVAHDVAHEVEYIRNALVFCVVELVALRLLRKAFVYEYALCLEVSREAAYARHLLRCSYQHVVRRELHALLGIVFMQLQKTAAALHKKQFGEQRALCKHAAETVVFVSVKVGKQSPSSPFT